MFDGEFSILTVRWINFLLILGGIVFAHILSRRMRSFYFGIPILVWLFQSFLFYSSFLLYSYGMIIFPDAVAEHFFSYWATLSKFLGLITMYIYLYYIYRSGWRGNGDYS